MTQDKSYFQISTLERGLQVLELLAENGALTVSELARRLDLNRSASHRFLATLQKSGYADRDENKKYYATYKMLQVGMNVANNIPLRRVARPFLQELGGKFEETVNLGYWDGRQIIHLDKIESREVLRIDPGIGTIAPGHCTSLGKAILAFLPTEELDVYLRNHGLKPMTPNTITTRQKLDKELETIRRRGYALDNDELIMGLRCVGGPVFDYTGHICSSISIAALAVNMSDKRVLEMTREVIRICEMLSRKLGASERVIQKAFPNVA